MTRTCSAERRPRLWKFSLRPMNSTSFQPTPIPSRNRPPHSTSSEAACFATSTAWRCARIKTPTAKPILCVQPDRKPNKHERIVIGGGGGADPPALMVRGGIGAEHVVWRHQMGIAQPLRRLGIVAQHRGTGADIPDRQ